MFSVEILLSNKNNSNFNNNNNNNTHNNNTANKNIHNLIQTVKLPRPPALPPPPPPPPLSLPPLQSQFISVSRSAFGYLSLKQHAYNSYTHLRTHINELNTNLKKTNRSEQKQCAKIELASLDYLSYEINKNAAQHANNFTYLKANKKTNSNILDLATTATTTATIGGGAAASSHTSIQTHRSASLHYLPQYTNINVNTTTVTNTAGAAMYDLLPVKDSFQFLVNILIVPIVFFSIFILILIINMISKM